MTDNDPLQRLRRQLVDAANCQAATGAKPRRHTRRAAWMAVAFATIAVPAGAATTGLIDLGSGRTSSGGTFTITRSEDNQASADPTRADGIGRVCEDITFRNKKGQLQVTGKTCRPRNAKLPDTILSAGFDVTPDRGLLIRGTARADVAKVTASGVSDPVNLIEDPREDLQRFNIVTTQDVHIISAYDADGRLLDKTTVPPGG